MKQRLGKLLRSLYLIYLFDYLRFIYHYTKTFRRRKQFVNRFPNVVLPPAYLVYESFDMNYDTYYTGSHETAKWVLSHFSRHREFKEVNILDWGCGPARIVRHLPGLLNDTCKIYGTDYNPTTINWCRKSIPGVNFNLNLIQPPLPYVNNSFDFIYGISIFTHLTEELHGQWFDELVRISKPGGIIFLTLQGNAFKAKLTESENESFDKGNLIIRGKTRVGHRTYSAYQPPSYVHKLFEGHTILEHHPGDISKGKPQQDIWLIKINKASL